MKPSPKRCPRLYCSSRQTLHTAEGQNNSCPVPSDRVGGEREGLGEALAYITIMSRAVFIGSELTRRDVWSS